MSKISHGVPHSVEVSRVAVGVRLFPSPWRQQPPSRLPLPISVLGVHPCDVGGPLASVHGVGSVRCTGCHEAPW